MEIFLNWVFKLPTFLKVVFLFDFWTATLKSLLYMKKEINDYRTAHENVTMIKPRQIITLVDERLVVLGWHWCLMLATIIWNNLLSKLVTLFLCFLYLHGRGTMKFKP